MYLEVRIEELCQGYLRYKFSSLGGLVPLLGRVFIWLSGDPRIPAWHGAKVVKEEQKRPVVVFSHGLAACRTSYSYVCTDLASRGYIVAAVEHGDGSGCLRTVKKAKDQCGPLSLVEAQRGSALIGPELHSVAPPVSLMP